MDGRVFSAPRPVYSKQVRDASPHRNVQARRAQRVHTLHSFGSGLEQANSTQSILPSVGKPVSFSEVHEMEPVHKMLGLHRPSPSSGKLSRGAERFVLSVVMVYLFVNFI